MNVYDMFLYSDGCIIYHFIQQLPSVVALLHGSLPSMGQDSKIRLQKYAGIMTYLWPGPCWNGHDIIIMINHYELKTSTKFSWASIQGFCTNQIHFDNSSLLFQTNSLHMSEDSFNENSRSISWSSPWCWCGTTCHARQKANRVWKGGLWAGTLKLKDSPTAEPMTHQRDPKSLQMFSLRHFTSCGTFRLKRLFLTLWHVQVRPCCLVQHNTN